MLFNRKAKNKLPVPTDREWLCESMSDALKSYNEARDEYNAYMTTELDSASAFAKMLSYKMEGYRVQYYSLRVEFEKKYGDLPSYENSLRTFFASRKENDLVCLVQNELDPYTVKSVSDRVQSLEKVSLKA